MKRAPGPWLLAALVAIEAQAQERSPVAAEALFRQGREAIKAGRIDEGCARLEASHRLDPTPGTLFNLADCAERQGKVASARQRYLDVHGQLSEADPRRAIAAKKAAELAPRVPTLTLRLGASPPDTRVLLDGAELGEVALGTPLPLDPGKHEIDVRAPGRGASRLSLLLTEQEHRTLQLEPGPLEAPAALPPAPPASSAPPPAMPPPAPPPASAPAPPFRGPSTSLPGLLLLGGGGLSLGASLFAGILVLDRKATVETHCRDKRCDDAGLAAGRSGQTLSTVSTVTFALGAAAIGAGAYLLLSTPRVSVSAGPAQLQARLRF